MISMRRNSRSVVLQRTHARKAIDRLIQAEQRRKIMNRKSRLSHATRNHTF